MKKLIFIFPCIFILFSFLLQSDNYAAKKASLWRSNSFVKNMYGDPKATSINDILTIQIVEASSASNKAGLSTAKDSSSNMQISAMLGLEKKSPLNKGTLLGHSTSNNNKGQGESTRQSSINAYITARVVDIMPNNNLIIEAKKELMINKEKQVVVLRGIVRPRDISYENVVLSNRIADMQVHFSGKGPVTEQTRRGWLSWVLSVIWPF